MTRKPRQNLVGGVYHVYSRGNNRAVVFRDDADRLLCLRTLATVVVEKRLDYVTGWHMKALDYGRGRSVEFAFVSTNSICQGEQAARLWQPFLDADYGITFAHQTFAWISEARGRANVHVVIVGYAHGKKGWRLFTYDTVNSDPVEVKAGNISPYLVDGPDVVVAGRQTPLSPAMPPVGYGSLPRYGEGLIITHSDDLPIDDPIAMKYIHPYLGSSEVVNGVERWCIWAPEGLDPGDRKRSQFLDERLTKVKEDREASGNPVAEEMAKTPTRFFYNGQPSTDYIGIPAQVSETRGWYTVAHFGPDTIASNTLYTAADPTGFLFGILSSSMFVAWIAGIGGKVKSDLRFSKSVVHNTFPLPETSSASDVAAVIDAGKKLLAVRAGYPDASLADLYDALAARHDIVDAHGTIDKAVDRLFEPRKRKWTMDQRIAHLLDRYEKVIAPLASAAP